MLDLPFLANLLGRILELINAIAGNDPDVIKVFNALIAFFGG